MTPLRTLLCLMLAPPAFAGSASTLGPSAGPVVALDHTGLFSGGVRVDAPLLASAARQGRVPGPPPLQVRLGADLRVAPHTTAHSVNTTSLTTQLFVQRTWPRGLILEGGTGIATARSSEVVKREPTWTTAPVLNVGVGGDLWMRRHRPVTAVLRPQVTLLPGDPNFTVSLAIQRRLDIAPGR